MSDQGFQKVEVPRGRFIGWAVKPTDPPQTVIVKVTDYDEQGGRTPNGNIVPQLSGTLVEPATNYRDHGTEREVLAGGELVTVTCSIANLRKGVKAAEPQPGDTVKLVYTGQYDTADGKGKIIDVYIRRGNTPTMIDEDDL